MEEYLLKQNLLELSLVAVPANPHALQAAVKSLAGSREPHGYITSLLNGDLPFDYLVTDNQEDIQAEFEEMKKDFKMVDNHRKIYVVPKSDVEFIPNGSRQMDLKERKRYLEKMLNEVDEGSDIHKYFTDELAIIEKQLSEQRVKSFPLAGWRT